MDIVTVPGTGVVAIARALRRSSTLRGSIGNAAWGVAASFARPLVMVAASPFLLWKLGSELFGIWMLVNAVSGTYGVFNLGLGDATIKFVSAGIGRQDKAAVVRLIRAAFSMTCLLSALIAAMVFFAAPLLANSVFKISPDARTVATHALRIGGLLLGLRAVESVMVCALRGYERYGITAVLSVSTKVLALVLAIVFAALNFGVVLIVATSACATLVSIVAHAIAARRLEPEISFAFRIDLRSCREIAGYGVFSWLQCFSAVVFEQMDRILVAVFLSTSALAYYTICLQLAQPIHMLAIAAFNFVFPLVSKTRELGRDGMRSIFAVAVAANITLAAAMAIPLAIFGKAILRIWMGSVVAGHSGALLAVLAAAFGLLAANVAAHYTLFGLGRVRFVSLLSLSSAIAAITLMCFLIPKWQLMGAAVSRLIYAAILIVPYMVVAARTVLTPAGGAAWKASETGPGIASQGQTI
jgi:O-antigen/teichoic acid export membrane protein